MFSGGRAARTQGVSCSLKPRVRGHTGRQATPSPPVLASQQDLARPGPRFPSFQLVLLAEFSRLCGTFACPAKGPVFLSVPKSPKGRTVNRVRANFLPGSRGVALRARLTAGALSSLEPGRVAFRPSRVSRKRVPHLLCGFSWPSYSENAAR